MAGNYKPFPPLSPDDLVFRDGIGEVEYINDFIGDCLVRASRVLLSFAEDPACTPAQRIRAAATVARLRFRRPPPRHAWRGLSPFELENLAAEEAGRDRPHQNPSGWKGMEVGVGVGVGVDPSQKPEAHAPPPSSRPKPPPSRAQEPHAPASPSERDSPASSLEREAPARATPSLLHLPPITPSSSAIAVNPAPDTPTRPLRAALALGALLLLLLLCLRLLPLTPPVSSPRLALDFHHVDFAYHRTRPVLRGVSFRVEPGQFIALLGPNGAGKSTLLRLALGVLSPSAGAVTLDGAPVAALPERARATRIAYAPQTPSLAAAFTVRQFVSLGRYSLKHDNHAVDRALDRADLADRAPDPFHALSAGQQQRAALARVLAQLDGPAAPGTRLLLADEPFAAMDPRHMLRCVSLLRALAASGVGVLCAMHDLTVALRCSTHALLLDASGRLAAAGLTSDILTPPVLSRVYGVGFDLLGHGRSAALAVAADTIG